MSYTTVLLTDGSSVYVSNSVPNTAGTLLSADNDVLNTAATNYTLFAGQVVGDPVGIQNFDLGVGGPMMATKRPGDIIDLQIRCTNTFGLWIPPDQIVSVIWAVEYGTVTLSDERIIGTDRAIVRVTGGPKLYSWHNIRATITCVSGQVYTPVIELQIVK